jgi:hypothetical protein
MGLLSVFIHLWPGIFKFPMGYVIIGSWFLGNLYLILRASEADDEIHPLVLPLLGLEINVYGWGCQASVKLPHLA